MPASSGAAAASSETVADRRLFERHRRGDPAARAALVERFLPLARRLALRYADRSEAFDDLVQVASIGLLKALDRYEPSRGTAFTSYAVPTILGELRRHFRDRTWHVRPPRRIGELAQRVEKAVAELTARLQRAPTVTELASALGVSEEDVLEAIQAWDSYHALSLDAPITDEQGSDARGDRQGSRDPGYNQAEARALLDKLLPILSSRDQEILRLRFVEDLTQQAIAERMGISQMHVSRTIRQSLARLRTQAGR